ncbi:D-alanine--D-alanine ligase [Patescibacteria group bacterium]|nr:D-alanine--D-alanine ligase [Patescibacteria group bacterium]MBU2218907.1 D-alanine--D-alanine ligase [Patescibacteria group bacterium]MBU2263381.1 D-alanine--D-alanine ligase [Patescibacteria group bacterium]
MAIKVGVLRGGISDEYKISLKTGESVLANLPEKYSGYDVILNKTGEWYFQSMPAYPERIFRSVDVIFNALHGHYGEDGKVQQLLEAFNIPYTGSGILASALGMNKILSREAFARAGLKVPVGDYANDNESSFETARRIMRKVGPPWVVKPVSSGSSIGVSIVKNFDDLIKTIGETLNLDNRIIVEEYLAGREVTCGVLERFRGEEHYALPIIEIIPPADSDFFDYRAKYSGETQEICPANLNLEIKRMIEDMARKAHIALGCRHYSRADFIISPRGIYILEVNTLPGLTAESLLPKAVKAVGSSYSELLDHLISLALKI